MAFHSLYGGRRVRRVRRVRRGKGFFGDLWSGVKSGVSSVANFGLPIVKNLAGDAIKGLIKSKLGMGRRRRRVKRVGGSIGARRVHRIAHRSHGKGLLDLVSGLFGGRRRRVRRCGGSVSGARRRCGGSVGARRRRCHGRGPISGILGMLGLGRRKRVVHRRKRPMIAGFGSRRRTSLYA